MSVGEQNDLTIPAELPILPLRGVVVYPMMWLPLTIGQERSIRLVDDALVDVADQRIIGLVTSQDPDVEEPNPDQIYQVGTAAIVHRMLRAPDGTIRLIVQGIERIRVDEYLQEQPYLRARVEVIPDEEGRREGPGGEALMRADAGPFPPAGVARAAHAGGARDRGHERDERSPAGVPRGGQHPDGAAGRRRKSSRSTRSARSSSS